MNHTFQLSPTKDLLSNNRQAKLKKETSTPESMPKSHSESYEKVKFDEISTSSLNLNNSGFQDFDETLVNGWNFENEKKDKRKQKYACFFKYDAKLKPLNNPEIEQVSKLEFGKIMQDFKQSKPENDMKVIEDNAESLPKLDYSEENRFENDRWFKTP